MNIGIYGNKPFKTALIHGGPGACGEMSQTAEALAVRRGVLEPLQSANSIKGQIEELKKQLEENADIPVTLIGFSWGAWLSFIFTAQYSEFVKKLILISSGPFEEKYAAQVQQTRLNRLNNTEKAEYQKIIQNIDGSLVLPKDALFEKLARLCLKTDQYEPLVNIPESIDFRIDIFKGIWPQAARMRKSGELLKLAEKICCPVMAIHGDYDPHPYEGVEKPLGNVLKNFHFILLGKCGHRPWLEKHAKEEFYKILEKELS
ncbi:MAG: alpha/beta hydrolase [Phycisphaerae bacterium]